LSGAASRGPCLNPLHLTLAQYLLGAISGVCVGFFRWGWWAGGRLDPGGAADSSIWWAFPIRIWRSAPLPSRWRRMPRSISGTHAGKGKVKWRCAGTYAAAGVVGAFLGSTLGKAIDGQKLLFPVRAVDDGGERSVAAAAPGNRGRQRQSHAGQRTQAGGCGFFLTGGLSGFFGIGGGFLIVPGLMFRDRHADHLRGGIVATVGGRVRRYHGGELCHLGLGGLAAGRNFSSSAAWRVVSVGPCWRIICRCAGAC